MSAELVEGQVLRLELELAALRERRLKTRNALIDELLLCPCGCSPTAAGSIPDDCKGAGKECKSRACALARAALALLGSPATAPPSQPHPDTLSGELRRQEPTAR